jgi:hypothetical protein
MTITEDFKKPINLIFLLLAIAGIALSFFFYFNGRKTKAISYQINEPSSLIYDSKNSSSAIKVLEKDSIPIKDNVYILTGKIWNSGDIPIDNHDVRESIALNLLSSKKILDFKIVKQSDPTIAKFQLSKKNNNSLLLSWRYFDPGYEIEFQIIYTGYQDSKFNLSGKVLDINKFEKETDDNTIWMSIISGAGGGTIGALTAMISDRIKTNKIRRIKKPTRHLFVISVLVIIVISLLIFHKWIF